MILAATMLLAVNGVFAYDFQVGGIYYNITSNTAPYTVEVTYASGANVYSGPVSIPSSVFYYNNTYTVTRIGANAFYGRTGLTAITIPNSVKSIGNQAFSMCSGLRQTNYTGTISEWCNIDFVNTYNGGVNPVSYSQNLYINNSLITNLVIPNTVDTIKQLAFLGDTAISSVTIPNSVTYIGDFAFSCCTNLTSVIIPNSVTSIGDFVFKNCTNLSTVIIGDSVSNIGIEDFYGCTNLTSVTIGNSVTSIGGSAFYGCSGLTSLTLPNSVTNIGSYAFYGCSGLTTVITPDSVVNLLDYAFSRCTNLTSVTIGRSVTRIGEGAFCYCNALRQTNYTGTIAQWCNIDINGNEANPVYYSKNLYINNYLVTNLVIPNTIDSIKKFAFCRDTSITSVTIPNSVINIGSMAFSGCTGITSITIPSSVTRIERYAFSGDTALSSITFLGANTGITREAFVNNYYPYNYCFPSNTQIYVPCWATSWYSNQFNSFSNFIEIMPYNYSIISQDTIMGTVATIDTPTCNNNSTWTVRATANEGYFFSHWDDGNTNAHRTLTLTQDTQLIAHFRWYNFSVVSEDTNKGTVQIITLPTHTNPQATIIALPNSGCTFSRWSDGNTQNPRTLTVTQDTVLIAYFTSNQGIAEAENDIISVRTANGHILLEGVGNERVYVSDVLGRVIYNATVNERAEIAVRNRGVYFVKVGSRPAQKVVVVR